MCVCLRWRAAIKHWHIACSSRPVKRTCSINHHPPACLRPTHSSLATSLLPAAHWCPKSRPHYRVITNCSNYFGAPVGSTYRKSTILKRTDASFFKFNVGQCEICTGLLLYSDVLVPPGVYRQSL